MRMQQDLFIEVDVAGSGRLRLPGFLSLPANAQQIVVFVHGSGSSRHSPRNQRVARALNEGGLGTLLFDLLMPNEAEDRANVFDIDLLAERVHVARSWLATAPETGQLNVGLFGASTGAAAALTSAARDPDRLSAIVSRGGRPDLAESSLPHVQAPTLFIVGALDHQVVQLNESAARMLRCEHRIEVVPGATHVFEEPGTLDIVAELAATWFIDHP